MAFKELRGFLAALEAEGELKKINSEVDWDEEIGAIYQEAIIKKSPAILMTNIRDYKNTHGKKISMLNEANLKRVCIALDRPKDSAYKDLVNMWRTRIKTPIKPVLVSSGPCKEVIHKDREVDLLEFPVPRIHPLDGGRYILTWAMVITKDPETGWVNAGVYRGMVLDKNSIGVLYQKNQHWALHGAKYAKMGKPMPVAAVIGPEPVIMMTASTKCPPNISEYDIAGAIRQEPFELVKCETVDLEVPAAAEIVLEGEMSLDPSTFRLEGPFGEYPGHYTSLGPELRPVFKVNCITHREDPLFTIQVSGVVPAVSPELQGNLSSMVFVGFANTAFMLDYLEGLGIPGVVDYAAYGPGSAISIVSIRQQYYGHAKQIASALWVTPRNHDSKYVIVVDEDIDVRDLHKVMLAIGNRTQGGKSINIYKDTHGGELDPGIHPDEKKKRGGLSNYDRVLIDATWPYEWEAREEWGGLKHPPGCRSSEKMIAGVRDRWREFGLT